MSRANTIGMSTMVHTIRDKWNKQDAINNACPRKVDDYELG